MTQLEAIGKPNKNRNDVNSQIQYYERVIADTQKELAELEESRLLTTDTFKMWQYVQKSGLTPIEYLNTPRYILDDFEVYERFDLIENLRKLIIDLKRDMPKR